MRRRGGQGGLRLALVYAIVLASLSLVVWRQSRALDALRSLDELRRERAMLEGERADRVRRLEALERRGRVIDAAADRLDMRVPRGAEIVILPIPTVRTDRDATSSGLPRRLSGAAPVEAGAAAGATE